MFFKDSKNSNMSDLLANSTVAPLIQERLEFMSSLADARDEQLIGLQTVLPSHNKHTYMMHAIINDANNINIEVAVVIVFINKCL